MSSSLIEAILAAAHQASSYGRLFSVSDPSLVGTVVYAQMDQRAPADFSHRDIVTVDTTNAHVLTVWHYGANRTLGDRFLWSIHPLHFGTLWGMGVKIVWFAMGVSLGVLSVTGVVMYWTGIFAIGWHWDVLRCPRRTFSEMVEVVGSEDQH
jgi:uncharacterized iron-regulated membrane protein